MPKLSPWYYVLAIACVLVVYKAFFMKPKARPMITPVEVVQNSSAPQAEPPQNGTSAVNANGSANDQASSASNAAQAAARPAVNDFAEQRRQASEAVVQEVTKKSGLQFPFPKDMQYGKLDMGDGFLGMYGANDQTKNGLAFVATRKNARPEEILQFVQDSGNAIPSLRDTNVRWTQSNRPKNFDANSGLSDATTWTGVDSRGNAFVMALVKRADGQGSYLFIQNGTAGQTIDNEGYYEQLKSQMVAEPIPAEP